VFGDCLSHAASESQSASGAPAQRPGALSLVASPQAGPLLRASPRYTFTMSIAARTAIAVLSCLSLSGCFVNLHGVQSTGGGTTTTVTSSQVSGAARFSGGQVAFSSGQVPPRGAPGGQVFLGKGASMFLVAGVVIADLLNYAAGRGEPRPLPGDAKIMETCSCYQKPVSGEQ